MDLSIDDPTTRRVKEAHEQVLAAHAALERGDAEGTGWRARRAVETMLLQRCESLGLEVPRSGPKGSAIGTMRKVLKHANALDRRTEDHVAHVQNVGNRATHAQAEDHHTVDLVEARGVLHALDRVYEGWRRDLPTVFREHAPPIAATAPAEAPPPSRGSWVGRVALGAFALASPFLAFFLVVEVLEAVSPPTPDVPDATTPPLVDPVDLQVMLEADSPVALQLDSDPTTIDGPGDPVVALQERVRAGELLAWPDLAEHDCIDLRWVRNAIWATHGHAFGTAEAQRRFPEADWPRRAAGRREIERAFRPVDERNRDLLNDVMTERGCDCPKPLRAKAPCDG